MAAIDQHAGNATFHHQHRDDDCDCPIHRDGDPMTMPLGIRFADDVTVEPISQHVAASIYAAHHSYMDGTPTVNLTHHGLFYRGQLCGAITWRHPLIRKLEHGGTTYNGDEIVEAARICLGTRMANLASASLAASMERFQRDHGHQRGIRLLLTFVRDDFDGSMIRALRDKGWDCTGKTDTGQAGNRPDKKIREQQKWRFVCPLNQSDNEQTTLSQWTGAL